jgi:chromosome segregation ATPase
MRFLGFLVLVAVIGLVAYIGCGPRGQVAMDQIADQLDKRLGAMNVQRKAIENKRNELQKQVSGLRERRITAEVKLDLLAEKKKKSEAALNEVKSQIEQLSELIKEANATETKTLDRNGKTYTAADLQAAANEKASAYKSAKAKFDSTVNGYNVLESSVAFLRNQETEATKLMNELTAKIAEIDDQKYAVDAVRENADFVTGENKSINANLEALTKDIEKLGIDVEAALRIESSKQSELTKSESVADELLSAAPTDLDSTQKMLEDLLK